MEPAMQFEVKFSPLHIHIHSRTPEDGDLRSLVLAIAENLTSVKETIMTTAAEFTAGFARVDAATTAIAALIRTLLDRPFGGMTAAEEDAAKAQLDAIATSLEAMAATPIDPVPVPVPVV